ncbi:aspartate/glutamate racemase family protein [Mesorhizobium sp. VK25A]|uniref:Aspartate/glutamate racemase family protein n=1 Tax=Mesorhizobium vachelliae TaxID=3072309 RepID=A0ABU5AAN7_9HYPH|nr:MULTISPECIES: aspartate/glutamate racemase family protein [unclassified Mesorhizobium]MDX8533278.1 aspartate/glutamate racemase family protein [Mesorhizobium sp. VK25D]MDX8545197.1 aspartate/glutamate racemase family protein [Mesorhizobium sp. VK25A]
MAIYRVRGDAQSYGHEIGILLIACSNPFPPGDVGNASSYRYPVLYETIRSVTIGSLINEGDRSMAGDVIAAALRLQDMGVKAITSDCGYMLHFQDEVAAALKVPVMLSSLLQLPLIASTLAPHASVGIICANASRLTQPLLSLAYPNPTRAVHIVGMEDAPAFRSAILDEEGALDTDAVEAEIVERAKDLVAQHPEVGAILLECSNLPPYAAAVQRATGRHVFDFLTMIDFFQAAGRRQAYQGGY